MAYYDLRDACALPGCPVCRLTLESVHHYIESMNYDSVNDPGFRAATRAAHGFCNLHAYQWLRQANVLGTAMIYRQVCADVQAELERMSFHESGWLETLATRLEHQPEHRPDCDVLMPTGQCPVCKSAERRERTLIDGVLEGMAEPAFRKQYQAESTGLCTRHLRMALCATTDASIFQTLRDAAVARHGRLRDQLAEIIRKHDYRFTDEPVGEERGATQRSVEQFTGAQGIAFREAPHR
jgi:hypothetical protein